MHGTGPHNPDRHPGQSSALYIAAGPKHHGSIPSWLSCDARLWSVIVNSFKENLELDPKRHARPRSAYTFLLEGVGYFRPGFLGQARSHVEERLTKWFGPQHENPATLLPHAATSGWQICHRLGGRFIPKSTALELYTRAYYEYLRANPQQVDWLTSFHDVYDTAPSNVNSGDNFLIQETANKGEHIHDIAIRIAMRQLGRRFAVRHDNEQLNLLEIRGKPSKGYCLSPGQVPFSPDIKFASIPGDNWWQKGTIEDFYQSSRAVRVAGFSPGSDSQSIWSTHAADPSLVAERIAARFIHNLLPSLERGKISISELSNLPWMIDKNCLPTNNWQYRPLSLQERCDVMLAACEMLRQVAQLGTEDLQQKLRPGLKMVDKFSRYFGNLKAGKPVPTNKESQDLTKHLSNELDGWTSALPLLNQELLRAGALPIFLARDGLGLAEYMRFYDTIKGAGDSEFRVIYMPGAPEAFGKNKRQVDTVVESVYHKAFELYQQIMDSSSASDKNRAERYLDASRAWVAECLRNGSPEGAFFKQMFEQFANSISSDHKRFVLVDTQGTGKTLLLLKAGLEECARVTGHSMQFDVLLGRGHKEGLGVPSIDRMYKMASNNLFEDIRWPFVFAGIDDQPMFQVTASMTSWLQLLWRSMSFYNAAAEERSRSLPGYL